MIYKELYDIPLDRFISLYCGDLNALVIEGKHSNKELEDVSFKLIVKYSEITGDKSISADICMRNDILNYNVKIACMDACLSLISIGSYKEACEIMKSFKYKCKYDKDSDIDLMRLKANTLLSESKMRLDMLINKLNNKRSGTKIDRDYFEKEKAVVMSYFKPFNDKDISAQTYANWIRIMSKQVKSSKK